MCATHKCQIRKRINSFNVFTTKRFLFICVFLSLFANELSPSSSSPSSLLNNRIVMGCVCLLCFYTLALGELHCGIFIANQLKLECVISCHIRAWLVGFWYTFFTTNYYYYLFAVKDPIYYFALPPQATGFLSFCRSCFPSSVRHVSHSPNEKFEQCFDISSWSSAYTSPIAHAIGRHFRLLLFSTVNRQTIIIIYTAVNFQRRR